MKRSLLILFSVSTFVVGATARDAEEIVKALRSKLNAAKTFTVDARIKLDIPRFQAPESNITIHFKAPNTVTVDATGFAMFPKNGSGFPLIGILSEPANYLDTGTEKFRGQTLRRIKILPNNDEAEVVVATILVDTAAMLPLKIVSTTRNGGTVVSELVYNNKKAALYCMPSYTKIMVDVPMMDIPSSITADLDENASKEKSKGQEKRKASVEIWFGTYKFN